MGNRGDKLAGIVMLRGAEQTADVPMFNHLARPQHLYYIETDDTGERTFYYWRNEAAAKFWLESEQSAAICEELATSSKKIGRAHV